MLDWAILRLRREKTDILIFLSNKRPLVGTIHITFLIYLTAIYGQQMKEIDFSILPRNRDFARFFLTVTLKYGSRF